MTDAKRERIAKYLLEIFRSIWCDRESDRGPYFNCSVCEFEDGGECILNIEHEARILQSRRKERAMTDITTYCDVIEECEDCPRYGDDCDGEGEEP